MSDVIKYFSSTHINHPTLTGGMGGQLTVLQACLVDGYNPHTGSSISIIGTVATINGLSAGHGYDPTLVVLVSGTGVSGLDGEHHVTAADSTTASFAVTSGQTAFPSGTVNVKVAPLGFTNAFATDSNVAVFRSANSSASNQAYLRVDDSQTYFAKVWTAESMSSISAGTGIAPGTTPWNTFVHTWSWYKSLTADSVERDWVLIGNDKTFFFLPIAGGSGVLQKVIYGFGDFSSYKTGDLYRTFLFAEPQTATSNSWTYSTQENDSYNIFSGAGSGGQQIARNATETVGPTTCFKVTLGTTATPRSGAVTGLNFPSLANNGINFFPTYLMDANCLRGSLPGLYSILNNSPFNDRNWITSVSGRTFIILVTNGYSGVSGIYGRVAIDTTGPW